MSTCLVSETSDIDRDVQNKKKPGLKDLFQELGLFDQTVCNRYSDSSRAEYSEELVRAWILFCLAQIKPNERGTQHFLR